MKKTIIMLIMGCVLLSGCGVSQEDYDKLEKKNKELSAELKEQKEECASLEERNESMRKKIDEQLDKEMALATPTAWAQTHFGQDCIVFADNNDYLQIVSKQEYSLSADGVKTIWNKVLESATTLGTLLDKINYERIAIKFPQVGGTSMIEFVMKKNAESYEFESWSINASNFSVLVPALEQAVK